MQATVALLHPDSQDQRETIVHQQRQYIVLISSDQLRAEWIIFLTKEEQLQKLQEK